MNTPLWLIVERSGVAAPCFKGAADAIVELGRVDARGATEELFVPHRSTGFFRLPIASQEQKSVSRRQLHLARLEGDRVRVTNKSASVDVAVDGREAVKANQSADLALPVTLHIKTDDDTLRVAVHADEPRPAAAAGSAGEATVNLSTLLAGVPGDQAGSMVSWWRRVIEVLQSAAHTEEFYRKATRALVDLIGLDVGAVFVVKGDDLRLVDLHSPGGTPTRPSRSLCDRVRTSKQSIRELPSPGGDLMMTNQAAIEAVVAAPILDRSGAVIGVLYGHRSRQPQSDENPTISHLEQLLVETLASGVATGLSRLDEQRQKNEQRATFAQFFSRELAVELEKNPGMLEGRETDVTVLFCDIRGFSAVSERLAPVKTMNWIHHILTELSAEVVEDGGVVVDYVGDELLAMWGAPTSQPDHAIRACRAARRMRQRLQAINERWQGEIGCATDVGIGINSSRACVGNTGSKQKFKYGPLGNGVNLGSRVQGTTKYLRVPAVVTGATRRQLDDSFLLRRLCSVRVVNIAEPVDLFELDCGGDEGRKELFSRYEEALACFEKADFRRAAGGLGTLLERFPDDGPALVLLSRSVDAMVHPPHEFSAVWQLPGK
ncbi:MAG: adenylate/guanylate cyclase domain-containing protein [Planctomycetota bacterium]